MTRPLRISLEVNQTLDQQPERNSPVCIVCGTWVCRECWQFRRAYADRSNPAHRICGRCGGADGIFLATRHASWKLRQCFWANGYRHTSLRRTPFVVPTIGTAMTDDELSALQAESDEQLRSLRSDMMRVPEEANISDSLLAEETPGRVEVIAEGAATIQPETAKTSVLDNNKYMKRDAMEWAIRLRETIGDIEGHNPEFVADTTVKMAQKIYNWLSE